LEVRNFLLSLPRLSLSSLSLVSLSLHTKARIPELTREKIRIELDPSWYQDWSSPYYKPSHFKVRRAIREFTDCYLTPNAFEWDQTKEIPQKEYKRIADFGILCAIAAGSGGSGWPDEEYSKGIPVPGGIDSKEWDAFHNLILLDELSRCASGGIM